MARMAAGFGLVVPGLTMCFLGVTLQGCGESDPSPVTSRPNCYYEGCECEYDSTRRNPNWTNNTPTDYTDYFIFNNTESSSCLTRSNEDLCDAEVCGSASFVGQDGRCTCQLYSKNVPVEGRAFLTDNGTCVASIRRSDGFDDTWSTDGFTDGFTGDVNPDLASHFISLGLAEHASVASFARVVMELMQLAAPADLVDRTLQAGREEVRHAQVAFSLARTWSAEGYQLGPLNGLEYAPVSFVQLARQTVFEAILGETAAFLRASLALRFATHQGVREFLLQVGMGDNAIDSEAPHQVLRYPRNYHQAP